MHIYAQILQYYSYGLHANPRLKPTGFDFLLCFTVIFACFDFKCSQHCFIHLKLERDEFCSFMCRYNDIF